MGSVAYQERRDVYAGDTGPVLEALFTEADGQTVRDLTGYCAWVSFWNYGATVPHVQREAKIYDAPNGLVRYYTQGDEWNTAATDVLYQFSIVSTEWGGTSVGRGFFVSSSPVQKRRVLGAL